MSDEIVESDLWRGLRAATPARVFLPRAGASLATRAVLDFQLAHAEARDAVHDAVDFAKLAEALASCAPLPTIPVRSRAGARRDYLLRPDLGRRLDDRSRETIEARRAPCDIVFVIADGLSAQAVAEHAAPMMAAALPLFAGWRIAPIVLVEGGRVAIGDEIAELLGAELAVVLIGERPGLTSPDSLGAYLTYAPRIGSTDEARNCLSNIRAAGMSYREAATRLAYLCEEARRLRLSGVALKDETPVERLVACGALTLPAPRK